MEYWFLSGEKFFEELLATKENTLFTDNKKIFRAQVREYDYADICTIMNPFHFSNESRQNGRRFE